MIVGHVGWEVMVDGAEEVLRSSRFKCELKEPVFPVAQWLAENSANFRQVPFWRHFAVFCLPELGVSTNKE